MSPHIARATLFTAAWMLLDIVSCKDPYLAANLNCVAKYSTQAQIDACRLLTHDAAPPDGVVVTKAMPKDGGSQ